MSDVNHQVLCALHARGRQAWPEVELDIATFSALASPQSTMHPVDEIRAGELYLALACAAGVERAIATFEVHYLCRIAPELLRRGYDAASVADVVQAVRVRFLVGEVGRAPQISKYNGRGALATWLRVAATRTAISLHRKHRRETTDEVDLVAAERSPELDLIYRRFGAEFEAAFRATFRALTSRERTLLRYQLTDRLGIDRIAAIYSVHRATAARWVAHAREALVDGVRRALQIQLGVGAEELDSLVRLIQSKLDLSLTLLVTPGHAPPQRLAKLGTARIR